MKLFVNDLDVVRSTLVKTAAPNIVLSDDVTAWPTEILAKFYKSVPYAGEYDVTIDLSNMDAEARTALGQVIVKAPRTLPAEGNETSINKKYAPEDKVIRVPLVVKSGVLSPMDIFVANGSMFPLTRRRIQRALFRPNSVDLLTDGSGVSSTSGMLTMPTAWRGSSARVPYKFAAAILPTVSPTDFKGWEKVLNDNVNLKEAALANPAVAEYLKKLSEVTTGPTYVDALASIKPTVFQIYHDDAAGEYVLRKAARAAFYPTEVRMTRKQALAAVGPEVVKNVDMEGGQTVATEQAAPTPEEITAPKPITESGTHVVLTTSGSPLVGEVYTDIRGFDGKVKPMKVFISTDGRFGSIQSDMWGYSVKPKDSEYAHTLPTSSDEPSGLGVFYYNRVAYGPCTIIGKFLTPEGLVYRAELTDDGEVELVTTRAVRRPTKALDGRYLIPESMDWCGIGTLVPVTEDGTQSSNAMMAEKTSAWEDAARTVKVVTRGHTFTFSGPPVAKLAEASRTDLKSEDALFVAALLGHDQGSFLTKTAEVAKAAGMFELGGCLPITPAAEVVKKASAMYTAVAKDIQDLRVDLLKEAVFVPDPNSVDALLSLNFITPANIAIFASYTDDIDVAAQHLAELLLYCRLGGDESLDEDALVNAIRGTEKVIEGLEKLKKPEPV